MWQNKLNKGEIQRSQMEEFHSMYRNVVSEFHIPVAVVKSEETDKKHTYEYRLHLPDGSVSMYYPSWHEDRGNIPTTITPSNIHQM